LQYLILIRESSNIRKTNLKKKQKIFANYI